MLGIGPSRVFESALPLGLFRTEKAAPAQDRNAKEEPEIIPTAIIRHGIDGNVGAEERSDPAPRKDKAVPQTPQKAGCAGSLTNSLVDLAGAS